MERWRVMAEPLLGTDRFKSAFVFSFDETFTAGFENGKTKVVVNRDEMEEMGGRPFRQTFDPGMHITVMICISAAGVLLRPFVILPLKSVPEDLEEFKVYMTIATNGGSGWINTRLLRQWTREILVPYITDLRRQFGKQMPALVLCDNHSTRADPTFLTMLHDNGITLLTLPAHTSHILQPPDLWFNGELKRLLGAKLSETPGSSILTAAQRRRAILIALRDSLSAMSVISPNASSFSRAGLVPWRPESFLNHASVSKAKPETQKAPPGGRSDIRGQVLTADPLYTQLITADIKEDEDE